MNASENKKYRLDENDFVEVYGIRLCRIVACRKVGDEVNPGGKGGYIEKEGNLSQEDDAWVYGDAIVSGNAKVYGDARVYGNARVYGDAMVSGNAKVYGDAWVYGDAMVSGNAWVYGDAIVSGNAKVYGDARVYGNARVYGDAMVSGNAKVYGDARVYGNARVYGDARVSDCTCYFYVHGFGSEGRATTFFRESKNKWTVKCGCFSGTIEEFKNKVKSTHRNSPIAKEYLLLADIMDLRKSRFEMQGR